MTVLPVDRVRRVCPEEVEAAVTEETILVSIMHVNNEVGTIQPIGEIGKRLAKYPKVLFHVDAIQSLGRVPLLPRPKQQKSKPLNSLTRFRSTFNTPSRRERPGLIAPK